MGWKVISSNIPKEKSYLTQLIRSETSVETTNNTEISTSDQIDDRIFFKYLARQSR